jgi:hypothetical protein
MSQIAIHSKEELWQIIKKQWAKELEQVKHILDYLNTYPEFLSAFDIDSLYTRHTIEDAFREWIWLFSKFDNKIETEFFYPYWIPISTSGYDFFIDISDSSFPLLETTYFFFEPYMWQKKVLYKSMQDLLLETDSPKQLRNTKDEKVEEQLEMFRQFMKQREQLAFSGKLEVEPVKESELYNEEEGFKKMPIEIEEDKLIVKSVSSLICSVLSFSQRIKVVSLSFKFGEPYENISKIKTIRDFIFVLREHGIYRVASYKLYINKEIEFEYNFNHFIVYSENIEHREKFINQFNSIYNS